MDWFDDFFDDFDMEDALIIGGAMGWAEEECLEEMERRFSPGATK